MGGTSSGLTDWLDFEHQALCSTYRVKLSPFCVVQNEADAYRKMQLRCEEVQGKFCLTNFWVSFRSSPHCCAFPARQMRWQQLLSPGRQCVQGMDFTQDKLRSLVRKWQTLIEAHVDVKTTDGYLLRMFCIGFTKKRPGQVKKTCYAQSSQIRQIRKKMVEIMSREANNCDLKDLVSKFIPEAIGECSQVHQARINVVPSECSSLRLCLQAVQQCFTGSKVCNDRRHSQQSLHSQSFLHLDSRRMRCSV